LLGFGAVSSWIGDCSQGVERLFEGSESRRSVLRGAAVRIAGDDGSEG
jgi:hypothetical protein